MSMIRSKILVFSLVVAIFVIACGTDQKSDEELIQGTWVLQLAKRNDKPTRSLDGMYMIFRDAKSFESNILGDSTSFSAVIENRRIHVEHALIQSFKIKTLNDSLMELATAINEDEIELVFNK